MHPNRRQACRAALGLAALPMLGWATTAWAHHGWGSFDTSRPIFLAGQVTRAVWANPHVEVELTVRPGLTVPPDLATRAVPAQRASLDDQAILSAAVVPNRRDPVWEIELAPLFRMRSWEVEPLRVGDEIMVVGYTFPQEQGQPILRAEYLFVGDKAYGLRSNPA